MDRVHSVTEKPLADIEFVALTIGLSGENQRHIGVLHRDTASQKILMMDLAWHCCLRNDEPDAEFLWVELGVHPKRLRQVATVIRRVWRQNAKDGIPYGFSPPNGCLDADTGILLLGPTRYGLTCASFVLALFDISGLPLLSYETWPIDRIEDAEWQHEIIKRLEAPENPPKYRPTPAHLARLRTGIGCVRFRPEEVAGAATETTLPVEFQIAERLGNAILQRLQGTQ